MKSTKKTVKPEDLPEIKFTELFEEDGTIRLNPFKIGSKTYRITGTKKVGNKWFQHVLCVETRKWSLTESWKIKEKVMIAKQKKQKPLVKLDELPENETIEEHKKKFPNQSNLFDFIPDVKKKT